MGCTKGKISAFPAPDVAAALQGKEGRGNIFVAETTLSLKSGEEAESTLILTLYHPNGFYAERFPSINELTSFVSKNFDSLRTQTEHFISRILKTGDEKLDEYLRWYMFAGVILTRLTRDAVLTMGYRELNQRDSYWTSWQHLVFWPTLERKMIEESASYQRDNGKIPTTILPLIEREDDLDINEYFILRASRYYKWCRDEDFLKQIYPSLVKAYEYLGARDEDGDGLLEQKSFWGDWKDVPGVQGRKYSPYVQLLWLAVLNELRSLAEQLGDAEMVRECTKIYELASSTLNKPVENGGLWNGKYYVNVWYNRRKDDHLLEDQTVGAVFGVISPQRLASIYRSLKANERPWGVRETFPYYDEERFGIRGGDYHNGAVWPYLNFVDAFGRFINGYSDDALRILKNVGYWDLEKFGDYLPHENIDGETGQNTHAAIQGWDAAYFGALYFGAFGIERLAKDKIQIAPKVPLKKPLKTFIILPEGEVMLSIIPQESGYRVDLTSRLGEPLKISFKAPNGQSLDTTLPPSKTISLTLR